MKEKFLTVEDVSKITTLAKSTLYNYVYYQTIPFTKIGGRVVFEEDKIKKWLKGKEIKPVPRKEIPNPNISKIAAD